MILSQRRRGEPLIALVLVMAGWVGVRAVAWDRAITREIQMIAGAEQDTASPPAADAAPAAVAARRLPSGSPAIPFAAPLRPIAPPPVLLAPLPPTSVPALLPSAVEPMSAARAGHLADEAPAPPAGKDMPRRIAAAGGHAMLWLAATALLPLPPLGIARREGRVAPPLPRWSGDGWLLLRRGSGPIAPGALAGTYGTSQAGAVIRYRLDPPSPHRPAAYLRATAALDGSREQEAALGLSARPLTRVPLVAMAEARIVRDGQGVRVRPAVAVVSELPPQSLPLGFIGEAYVQAGYVGGRGATGFADGLVRAERPVASGSGFDLRAGGGAWGATQRGAQRFDIGPVASVRFRLGTAASARLEADWRFRIGGDARPGSGPALTLSAGF